MVIRSRKSKNQLGTCKQRHRRHGNPQKHRFVSRFTSLPIWHTTYPHVQAPRSWHVSTLVIPVLLAIIGGIVWHVRHLLYLVLQPPIHPLQHATSDTALHQQLRDLKDNVTNTLTSLQEQNPIYTWWSGTNRSTHPGVEAARAGLLPQFNIVIVPGFVTTGLEVWRGTSNCSEYSFRQRIWYVYYVVCEGVY